MNIAIFNGFIGAGFGQERVLQQSIRLLRNSGHKIFLVGISEGDTHDFTFDGKLIVPELAQVNWRTHVGLAKKKTREVMAFLEAHFVNVVHFWELAPGPLVHEISKHFPTVISGHTFGPTCPAGGRWVMPHSLCKEKSALTCLMYDLKYRCLSGFTNRLSRIDAVIEHKSRTFSLNRRTVFFAISSVTEEIARREGWGDSQIIRVGNPVPTLRSQKVVERPDVPLFVTAARLVRQKGIHIALEALKTIENRAWNFWICGDGPERAALERRANDLGISHRVKFLGQTGVENTRAILQQCRAVLHTNLGPEAFGMTVAEAIGLGVPVIASRMPAVDEFLSNGQTGLLFAAGNAAELAHCLEEVLGSNRLCDIAAEEGPKFINHHYSEKAHVLAAETGYLRCMDFFEGLAKRKSPPLPPNPKKLSA